MDFRHEYKYMIPIPHAVILKERLAGIMQRDSHTGEAESYEIRSIYFDDYENTCYYQNEAGTDPRSKYRIRIYNASDDRIMLEKKIKKNGMTRKLQQELTYEEYRLLTDTEIFGSQSLISFDSPGTDIQKTESQKNEVLLQELLLLKQTKLMQPKVIVSYERTPFIETNGNVRITFDDGTASSWDLEDFFDPCLHKRPIMPAGMTLMEVKFDEFLPSYIKEALETGHLRQTNFSKYFLCRRYHL